MSIWMTIFGMAVVTYLTRAATMLALRREVAPWVRNWLGYVPVAVFTALILPPLLLKQQDDTTMLAIGPALPAGLVAALVAWRTNNVLLTIAVGFAAFWAARWAGM